MNSPPLEVVVWGDYACFTRPEMKVERVSYPVMTPSAARGILEAICWKPEISWLVREIHVLKPIRWFSIKRNEVSSRMSYRAANNWKDAGDGYFADEDRTQRATLCLRDVAYLIKADIVLRPHATDDVAKYRDQFRRRVENGKCFHRPAFGCREFAAWFRTPDGSEKAIEETTDLGRMLFDLDFDPKDNKADKFPGTAFPHFFSAKLEQGVLHVPQNEYSALRWAQEVKS
jgi:CRISPR-associated protein Cas5d